jgi:hypothetical protein
MDPSTIRVPDGIEPIVGYRCWCYMASPGGVSLFPLSRFGSGRWAPSAWAGAESRWVEARCIGASPMYPSQILREVLAKAPGVQAPIIEDPPHEVPMVVCSCGFYAMRDLVPELVRTISQSLLRAQIHVLGRVLLAGKVIEHAEGYRAERARIAELIPVKGTERTVSRLAAALGLPMGVAV